MTYELRLRIKAEASLTGCPGLLRYHTRSLCSRLGHGSGPSVLAANTGGQAEGRVIDKTETEEGRATTQQTDRGRVTSRQTVMRHSPRYYRGRGELPLQLDCYK